MSDRQKKEKKTAPRAGLEPATFRLTAERTANCAIEASEWASASQSHLAKVHPQKVPFLCKPKIGLDRD